MREFDSPGIGVIRDEYIKSNGYQYPDLFWKLILGDSDSKRLLDKVSVGVMTGYISPNLDFWLVKHIKNIKSTISNPDLLRNRQFYLVMILLQLHARRYRFTTLSVENAVEFEHFLQLDRSFQLFDWKKAWEDPKHRVSSDLMNDAFYLQSQLNKIIFRNLTLSEFFEVERSFEILSSTLELQFYIEELSTFLQSVSNPFLRACYWHCFRDNVIAFLKMPTVTMILNTAISIVKLVTIDRDNEMLRDYLDLSSMYGSGPDDLEQGFSNWQNSVQINQLWLLDQQHERPLMELVIGEESEYVLATGITDDLSTNFQLDIARLQRLIAGV